MKDHCEFNLLGGVFCAALLAAVGVVAQDTPSNSATPAPAAAQTTTSTKLSYGVEDVLKLSRAHVSEDIIVSFIRNSGTIYNLEPKDIVYLKEQGVSDTVVNAMLQQRQNVAQATALAAAAPAPTADANVGANTQGGSVYDQPTTVVQPAPTYSSPSSVYGIPYPTTRYYYYPYYGYYYPSAYGYYGYWGPSVNFSFGFGRGWGHGRHWHR